MLRRSKTFTLVEVMIVVGILAILLPALLKSIVGYSMLNAVTKDKVVAIADCSFGVEQMRSISKTATSLNEIIPVNWPDSWVEDNSLLPLSITYSINWVNWTAANGVNNLPSEVVSVTYTDLDLTDSTNDPLDYDPLAVTVEISWQGREGRTNKLSSSTLITLY